MDRERCGALGLKTIRRKRQAKAVIALSLVSFIYVQFLMKLNL
jgi:hypothetical protein